jgi:catechol 2,3-dioxygenase-like lactoylglutathione lyase family enzyme
VSIVSLQHVQVNVPRALAAEARRFYGDLLGLQEMPRPGSLSDAGREGAWYRLGAEQELHLYFNPDPAFDPSSSSQHPALITDDLDGLRARLAAAGLELEEAIPIAGRERFFARDPGGNRIEFLSFAGAPSTERGNG